MKEANKDPLQSFAKVIAKNKKLFKKQFKEVEEKYPLIILAYRVQQAVIADLSIPSNISELGIGSIYGAFGNIDSEEITKQKVKQQQRLRKLKTCLIRAHSSGSSTGQQYQAGVACFENYASGDD